jgi:hypothetical protein
LTPDEKSFYERADAIKAGVPLKLVEQQLGEPSRTVDGGPECVKRGGRKEWVYDSFKAAEGRKRLPAYSFSFCADQKDTVVEIFQIEY